MAYAGPVAYAHDGRDLPDASYRRDLYDSPYRRDEPMNYYGRGLAPSTPYGRSPVGLGFQYNPAYNRPAAVGMLNDRLPYPSNYVGEEMALSERLAATEMAQPPRPWPTSAQTKDLVVHVIEAAESVLRDQASALLDKEQENEHLRSLLRVREWKLQNSNMEKVVVSRPGENQFHEDCKPGQSPQRLEAVPALDKSRVGDGLTMDPQSSLIVHPAPQPISEMNGRKTSNGMPSHGINGTFGALNQTEGGGYSQISSPSIRPHSEVDHEARQVWPQYLANVQTSKQEPIIGSFWAHEEVKQLRKQLSDAEKKEMKLVHEKYMLEKHISDLHLTIDQYQKQLADAASRASSIREVLEKNTWINSELKAAEQEKAYYASSLLDLLVEFNMRPSVTDAHSIVSHIKVLIQHLCDRNNLNEGKPKDTLHPQHWRTDLMYQSPPQFASRSPMHRALHDSQGLEIVPQQPYLQQERPVSPTSPLNHPLNEWDIPGTTSHFGAEYYSDSGSDRVRCSPYAGQSSETLSRGFPHVDHDIGHHDATEAVNNVEEESINVGHSSRLEQHERAELLIRSPQLPTLPEEPNSSASEGLPSDEDPLPAIEELCINGEALLGNKIGASGFSINGTSLCHFQWVRHYRDGTFTCIHGAGQPDYTITADDVDTMILLECTPMDERNRKGEMVRVFANDHNWITLEPYMRDQIDNYITAGQAIFDVKFVGGSSPESIYESGVLTLKRSHYELKRSSAKKVVANDRYTSEPTVEIKIPNGNHSQCMIVGSHGSLYFLDLGDGWTRDLVVLTMREFIKGAIDRKRAKKRLWLSKK
eukprot:c29249_g1_i2 orf=524-2968(-)